MNRYQVIVGNIGTVMSGDSGWAATSYFKTYVGLSKADYSSAAGEDVTLMDNGEPVTEYTGWLSMEMNDE